MEMAVRQRERAAILEHCVERAIRIDDLSDIRHLHRSAFHKLADRRHAADLAEAFDGWLYNRSYTASILNADLVGLWLDKTLIGTAGWQPTEEAVPTARIMHVSVSPLFARLGLGHYLVSGAEERARVAGFTHFSTRATANAVPFFESMSYSVTSHGVTTLGEDADLPVTYMRRH